MIDRRAAAAYPLTVPSSGFENFDLDSFCLQAEAQGATWAASALLPIAKKYAGHPSPPEVEIAYALVMLLHFLESELPRPKSP